MILKINHQQYLFYLILCEGLCHFILLNVSLFFSASYIRVEMGAHKIYDDEDTQVSMTTYDFFAHEDYNKYSHINDIGLVRLPEAVEFTGNIAFTKM